eukprot:307429-Pelagomonas_calceolata.AAC.3
MGELQPWLSSCLGISCRRAWPWGQSSQQQTLWPLCKIPGCDVWLFAALQVRKGFGGGRGLKKITEAKLLRPKQLTACLKGFGGRQKFLSLGGDGARIPEHIVWAHIHATCASTGLPQLQML